MTSQDALSRASLDRDVTIALGEFWWYRVVVYFVCSC